jgi:hypothetical protein
MWTTNRHNERSLAMAEILRIHAPQPGLRAGASISGLYQRPAELCEARNSGSLIRFSTSSLGDSKRFSKREYLQSRCGRTAD